ncbi:hypothetical protein [Prochlorococcus sp. MIT 1223]|uniref:hypothetical protein n=1 Tax=Prochlorococcus sp. MIT 1223 TaxID=3096217 RepID=UPI002A751C10|nr:hypothetical protein [Prochlorococcus sp. MIT 1223]
MLIPLRPGELQKLIPAVATSNQFGSALGNPRKILQKIMISSIGGVITLLISQSQVTSRFYSLWLILGVVFILYILWSPIYEASKRNSSLRSYTTAAIFEGIVSDVYTKELIEDRHEQANKRGQLELVENRRLWMIIELEDDDGYLGELKFPIEKQHQFIRTGLIFRCLVFSNNRQFDSIADISDGWLPEIKLWVGEYPFLLRPAFEDLCNMRLNRV